MSERLSLVFGVLLLAAAFALQFGATAGLVFSGVVFAAYGILFGDWTS